MTKREEERGRKRGSGDDLDDPKQQTKRSRSSSSHSMDSVSTISTNRSPSVSPVRHRRSDAKSTRHRTRSLSPVRSRSPKKRRYSDSSSHDSDASYSSPKRRYSRSSERTRDRDYKRKPRESSPDERGRSKYSTRDRYRGDESRTRNAERVRESGRDATRRNHGRYPSRSVSPPASKQRFGHGREDNDKSAQPRRERSLSPFSKRLALTQAMNMGR